MADARVGMTITESLTLLDLSDPRQPITGAAFIIDISRDPDGDPFTPVFADVWVSPNTGPVYVTNLHVRGKHTMSHVNGAVTNPGMFYELRGSGSPEGAAIAGIGSTWLDTTNGKLYVKGTGTGNTGWVAQA